MEGIMQQHHQKKTGVLRFLPAGPFLGVVEHRARQVWHRLTMRHLLLNLNNNNNNKLGQSMLFLPTFHHCQNRLDNCTTVAY
jgi:hypothetical protein